MDTDLPKLFLALAVAYFVTSLGHFSHNAEFICEYPNLPAWLTRAKVYAAWAAITLPWVRVQSGMGRPISYRAWFSRSLKLRW